MGTLTDEDLKHLLGEAAASFEEPEDGTQDVLDARGDGVVVPLRRRRWVQVPAAAAVVAGAVLGGMLLAGQLGGTETVTPTAAPPPAASGATAPGALSNLQLGYNPSSGALDSRTESADGLLQRLPSKLDGTGDFSLGRNAAPPVAAGQAPAAGPVAPAAPLVSDGARVVKSGSIALIVDDGKVTPTLTGVQQLATAAGGIVSAGKTEEFGPTPSGSVTLRVPVARFEDVVAEVRGLDAKVRSASTTGQDVTAQYADLEVQIKTLSAARDRFLVILSNAKTVGDILAVQQRVDDATGKIDRLEGQRRLLANQSDMSTLEVSVTEADDPVVTKTQKKDNGLVTAFKDAGRGFTSGVEGLVRISGRAVLLALCLVLAFVVLRVGWRLTRRRLV